MWTEWPTEEVTPMANITPAQVLENGRMMADDARRYVDRMAN